MTIAGVSTLQGNDEASALERAVEDALGPRAEADVVPERRRRLLQNQFVASLDVRSSRTPQRVADALGAAVADGTLTSSMRHYGAHTDLATAEIVSVAVVTDDSSSSKSGFSVVYVVIIVVCTLVALALCVVMRYFARRDRHPKRDDDAVESRVEPDDEATPTKAVELKAPVTISPPEETLRITHELTSVGVVARKKGIDDVGVGVDDIAIDAVEPSPTRPEEPSWTEPEESSIEDDRPRWPGGSRLLAAFDI